MPAGIALTIGLNSVDPKHYGGWEMNLNACEADAIDLADIAKSQNFSTKILLTKEAKRSNVIEEISRASASLKASDIFMITYSGTGGDVPDPNNLSPSGRLETWCLYDGQLIKYELCRLLAKFQKGVRILTFADICHSGFVTKLAYYEKEVRYKFMPPDVALRTYRQNKDFYGKIIKSPELKQAKESIKASVLWLVGCQDNQAAEDGDFNGLFTDRLIKVWKNGAFKGDYADFYKSIVKRMPPYQTPNFFRMGSINKKFKAQRPFTI